MVLLLFTLVADTEVFEFTQGELRESLVKQQGLIKILSGQRRCFVLLNASMG